MMITRTTLVALACFVLGATAQAQHPGDAGKSLLIQGVAGPTVVNVPASAGQLTIEIQDATGAPNVLLAASLFVPGAIVAPNGGGGTVSIDLAGSLFSFSDSLLAPLTQQPGFTMTLPLHPSMAGTSIAFQNIWVDFSNGYCVKATAAILVDVI